MKFYYTETQLTLQRRKKRGNCYLIEIIAANFFSFSKIYFMSQKKITHSILYHRQSLKCMLYIADHPFMRLHFMLYILNFNYFSFIILGTLSLCKQPTSIRIFFKHKKLHLIFQLLGKALATEAYYISQKKLFSEHRKYFFYYLLIRRSFTKGFFLLYFFFLMEYP